MPHGVLLLNECIKRNSIQFDMTLTRLVFLCVVLRQIDAQITSKLGCPVCDMDVKTIYNGSIKGNQKIYACEMAGHINKLIEEPNTYLKEPKPHKISEDEIYKNATQFTCPVCGAKYKELSYSISWGEQGDQKIFACSLEHAQQIKNNPTNYISTGKPLPPSSFDPFCNAGTSDTPQGFVMFDGFQTAFGKDALCAMLLFQPFVLTSELKYALAFIGVVLLAMSLEVLELYRDRTQRYLFTKYGRTINQGVYLSIDTPSSAQKSSKMRSLGNGADNIKIIRKLPLWCKGIAAALYMVAITVAYFLMLIVMMYESLFFIAVIIGLGLGFALFKDTQSDVMSGSIDPCCST
uniref:Copper transport protein n=1 Tax=Albugo laibachii Nc14 TaxID=890382 RepID=F0WA46_9STRA|nr:transmembrane protein putative [Albugo laibachii Nc14]|eukprot:CCA18016.1 transmembrane protein putative [Albugo laibachii Nc14]